MTAPIALMVVAPPAQLPQRRTCLTIPPHPQDQAPKAGNAGRMAGKKDEKRHPYITHYIINYIPYFLVQTVCISI